MKYSEIITENKKDLYIISRKQLETMLTYNEIKLDGGSLIIDIDKSYLEINFPPGFIVDGSLIMKGIIIALYGDLTVNGSLYISGDRYFRSLLKVLPEKLKVGGDLKLEDTGISKIPKNLIIGGALDLSNTKKIDSLSKGLNVAGDLILTRSRVTYLESDLIVGGDLIVTGTRIYSVPKTAQIRGLLIQ